MYTSMARRCILSFRQSSFSFCCLSLLALSPADHGAQAKRDRNCDLYPDRNELGRAVQRALVGVQGGDLFAVELMQILLQGSLMIYAVISVAPM
jgi:hypothetical protein